MLAAGISAKVVADRLGHSIPPFTPERYAHAEPALHEDAAGRLQNVITERPQAGYQPGCLRPIPAQISRITVQAYRKPLQKTVRRGFLIW